MYYCPITLFEYVPQVPIIWLPKNKNTFRPSDSRLTEKIFMGFFRQEVDIRDRMGRTNLSDVPSAGDRYEKMLNKLALKVWKVGRELSINPVNLTFLFLNRYYPIYIGKGNAISKMSYFWDDFLINLSHEKDLLLLMNYTEEQRKIVCCVIGEFDEARKSAKFERFLQDHVKGYKFNYVKHRYERSKLFETVLVMLEQIAHAGLDYFLNNHGMEILKAHSLFLSKFGDPIQMHIGHLVGKNAMERLRAYQEWVIKNRARRGYAFGTVHQIGEVKRLQF